jgi:8-amino-7-oxononanoate synthase
LRAQLHANIAQFRRAAAQLGLPLMASDTAIQPLLMGADADALALSAALEAAGYWASAIRPPTVPEGSARLRITLSAAHTTQQIDGLLDALARSYTPPTQIYFSSV